MWWSDAGWLSGYSAHRLTDMCCARGSILPSSSSIFGFYKVKKKKSSFREHSFSAECIINRHGCQEKQVINRKTTSLGLPLFLSRHEAVISPSCYHFGFPTDVKLCLQLEEVICTSIHVNNRHAHTHTRTHTKQMWREFPLAAEAFESSSGIPFLSLPNMGGIVREREAERGRQSGTPSWCQSSGTVSLTLTGNSQEGMPGMPESPKSYARTHVCKIGVSAHAHTPRMHPHTLTRTHTYWSSPVLSRGRYSFP